MRNQRTVQPPYSDEQMRSIATQIVCQAGSPTWDHVYALAAAYLKLQRVIERRDRLQVVEGGRT